MKILFNRKNFSFRLQFALADLADHDAIPQPMLERVQLRMSELRQSGVVAGFQIHFDSAQHAWRELRGGLMATMPQMDLRLATGWPVLPGLKIRPSWRRWWGGMYGWLELTAPAAEVARWDSDWISRWARQALGDQARLDFTIFTAAWAAASRGFADITLPVYLLSQLEESERKHGPGFNLVLYPKPRRIVVELVRPAALATQEAFAHFFPVLLNFVRQLEVSEGVEFLVLEQQLRERCAQTYLNARHFYYHQAVYYLAAIHLADVAGRATRPVTSPKGGGTGQSLVFSAPDPFTLQVTRWPRRVYDRFYVDQDWLFGQAAARGFAPERNHIHWDPELGAALAAKQSLAGRTVLTMPRPEPGKDPYLDLQPQELELEGDAQQQHLSDHPFIKGGQIAAQLKYRVPPLPGYTVHGKTVFAPRRLPSNLEVGPGLDFDRRCGFFYATYDGIPVFDGTMLRLDPAVIIEGNLNHRVGDLNVKGNCLIKGDVESGIALRATGRVEILGTCAAAILEAGGDLRVQGGIVAGARQRYHVTGSLEAGYLENARISVGESMRVIGNVLGSDLVCGGDAHVGSESSHLLLGGVLYAGGEIFAHNVGTSDGVRSSLNAGMGGRGLEHYVDLSRQRKRLRAQIEKLRASGGGATEAEADQIETTLVELAGELKEIQASLVFRPEAQIHVRGLLSELSRVSIGGKVIPLIPELRAIRVVSIPVRGTHFQPLKSGSGGL